MDSTKDGFRVAKAKAAQKAERPARRELAAAKAGESVIVGRTSGTARTKFALQLRF